MLVTTPYGCPFVNADFSCGGTTTVPINRNLVPVSGTNYQPRMSTGLELQVIMPVINAPFRFYYAYNPLRLFETVQSPTRLPAPCSPRERPAITPTPMRLRCITPQYLLREPRKTFRFTVATTF